MTTRKDNFVGNASQPCGDMAAAERVKHGGRGDEHGSRRAEDEERTGMASSVETALVSQE